MARHEAAAWIGQDLQQFRMVLEQPDDLGSSSELLKIPARPSWKQIAFLEQHGCAGVRRPKSELGLTAGPTLVDTIVSEICIAGLSASETGGLGEDPALTFAQALLIQPVV
jgi:hypothetical protein